MPCHDMYSLLLHSIAGANFCSYLRARKAASPDSTTLAPGLAPARPGLRCRVCSQLAFALTLLVTHARSSPVLTLSSKPGTSRPRQRQARPLCSTSSSASRRFATATTPPPCLVLIGLIAAPALQRPRPTSRLLLRRLNTQGNHYALAYLPGASSLT